MRQPIVALARRRAEGEHPGLLLSRYLSESVAGGGNPEERLALLDAALAASRSASLVTLYRMAFDRPREGSESFVEVTTPPHARLIVGLGQKGVLEVGLRLHHTYGVPLVPGSALKGLAAHYAHEVWGDDQRYRREAFDEKDEDKGRFHRMLFGTTDESGCIRFEDAWAVPGTFRLHRDVMTPHHMEWQTDPTRAPTDFDDPTPVPYLTVSGAFRLGLSWQGPASDQSARWVARTMALLLEALAEWGVGGKTSSGYGRLVKPGSAKTAAPVAEAMPYKKRDVGAPAKVKILAARPKGGFDVKEEGRPKGTLTLGSPPAGVVATADAIVDVFVAVDDPRNPQYKWTHIPPAPPKPGNKPRR